MDENKQAILLLSTYFSSPKKGDSTPLTPMEYGRFAYWLRQNHFQPKDLFHRFDELLREWVDPKKKITSERVKFLIGRGMAMGMALEKWQSSGIWVITRYDPDYPAKLKMHLNENAPALIFGVGNKQLLSAGGLSMVGSRNIDSTDRQYTNMVAQQAAREGLNVVSGGARGVDETAMLASLEAEGTALGILANDLLKAAISGKWRKYLKSNQLVLVSTYYPEAHFNPGNAMGRNKYIYCLSDYALVVRSDEGKGGTWAGANENLKKHWVPLFVKAKTDAVGNHALIKKGALPLNSSSNVQDDKHDWLLDRLIKKTKSGGETIVVISGTPMEDKDKNSEIEMVGQRPIVIQEIDKKAVDEPVGMVLQEQSSTPDCDALDIDLGGPDIFYQLFVKYIKYLIEEQSQITLAELKRLRSDLTQKQIIDWLSRASEEELIDRKGKKHTYILKEPDLFGGK